MPDVRPVFNVAGLSVSYRGSRGNRLVVSDVSFELRQGRILGLAGETGCGKSTVALASTGFHIAGMAERRGMALLNGVNLLSLKSSALREVWGREIAFVPQQPSGAFSPTRKLYQQLDEALAAHSELTGPERRRRIEGLIENVGLSELTGWDRRYSFEFSGGQLQRFSLAAALLCNPKVVIFDEPTTSLDPTTQETVVNLVRVLVEENDLAALYISHDIALLRSLCDDISIMYGGEVVESGRASDITGLPRHPYTSALVAAVPTIDSASLASALPGEPPEQVVTDRCGFANRCPQVRPECVVSRVMLRPVADRSVRCVRAEQLQPSSTARDGVATSAVTKTREGAVLEVEGVTAAYHGSGVPVLRDVSIDVAPEEILAVVGESGSGKSTLLRVIAGLHPPASGQLALAGAPLALRLEDRTPTQRRKLQLVFQDAGAALNPRHTVGRSLLRAMARHRPELGRGERRREAEHLLEQVHLPANLMDAFPSQISGGQRQRVNLARALCANPEVLLCDEVTSSLDVSVQAGILRLISELRREAKLAVVFVTHDLAVVRSLSDRVVVMWNGVVVEHGDVDQMFSKPSSPQAQLLLEAAAYKSQDAFAPASTTKGQGTYA